MTKLGPQRNQTNYVSFESNCYPTMHFLLDLNHCVKRYRHFCQIFSLQSYHTQRPVISECVVLQVLVFQNVFTP